MSKFDMMEQGRMTSLGPFGVNQMPHERVHLYPSGEAFEVDLAASIAPLAAADVVNVGQLSPPHPITLTNEARIQARIPMAATHFCWAYPLAGVADVAPAVIEQMDHTDPLVAFVIYGGFVYIQATPERDGRTGFHLLQINAIGLGNGLFFSPGKAIPLVSIRYLQAAGRFQRITVPALKEFGTEEFCWINPGEVLQDIGLSTENGAFVYRYRDNYVHYFEVLNVPVIENKQASEARPHEFKPFDQVNSAAPPRPNQPALSLEQQLNAARKKLNELNDRFDCKLCYNETVTTVFAPCGHAFMCKGCATDYQQRKKTCPVCNEQINGFVNMLI